MNGPEYTADLFVRAAPGITDPALVRALNEQADSIQTSIQYVRREVVDVKSDPALSPRGVQLKLPAVAVGGAQRLLGTVASMKQLSGGIERSGAILSTGLRHRLPPNVDEEAARWSEREARDKLSTMAPLERESLYIAACQRGDVSAIRAFEQAPSLFPLLSEAVIARGAETFAQSVYPEEWSVLQQQKATLSLMDSNLSNGTALLVKLCGSSGAADPIATMAGMAEAPESN
jgi:hypothetical protein